MPVTNIKLINYSDGQNLAIDKINHNFDEIVEAHGGSVGETGPTGDRGPIGNNGPVGTTGNDGPRGTRWFIQNAPPYMSGNGVVYGDYWVNTFDGEINVFGPTGWNDTGYNISSSGSLFSDIDSYYTSGGTGISVKLDQITPQNYKFIVSDKSSQSGIINQKLAKFLISTDSAGDPSPLLEFMKSDIISANPSDYALHPTFSWASSLPTDNDLKLDVPGGSFLINAYSGFESKSKSLDVSAGNLISVNYGTTSGSSISATGGINMKSTNNGSFVIYSDNLEIDSGSGLFKSNVIVNGSPSGTSPSVSLNINGTGGLRTERSSDTFNTISNSVYNVSLETASDKEFYINTKGKTRTKKIRSGLTYQSYQNPSATSGSGVSGYVVNYYFVSKPGGPVQSTVMRNGNTIIITPTDPGMTSTTANQVGVGLYSDPLYSLWGPNGIENGQSIDVSVYCSPDASDPVGSKFLFKHIGYGTTGSVTHVVTLPSPAVSIDFTITKGISGSNTTVYYKAYAAPGITTTGNSGSFTV